MANAVQHPDKPSSKRAEIGRAVAAKLAAEPGVTRVAVDGAQVFFKPDFVTDAEAADIMAMIDANSRPSTTLAENGDPDYRTSYSCDMDRGSDRVRPIDCRIAELLGISHAQGETMQGQRYALNQHFRAHHDYFRGDQPYWPKMEAQGGQRTWTAMIYLNDVGQGGATWFPQAGIKVPPRKHMILIWNNMNPDGSPNPLTLHEGMPVLQGAKYIVTKWFREGAWC